MSKTLITGTGRCGTSFLIQLFTNLGFDTGYTPEEAQIEISRHNGLNGGIEHGIESERTNRANIIKNPMFFYKHEAFDELDISCVILCVRDIEAASASRQFQIDNPYHNYAGFQGGAKSEGEQKAVNARAMYRFIELMSEREIELKVVNFPLMVDDWEYLYNRLFRETTYKHKFKAAFNELSDPEKVRF